MDKQKIILIALLTILLVNFGIFLLVWKNQKNTPVKTEPESARSGEEKVIGGQRDEHGCLGPAGYSWDEEFKVCVRVWEVTDDKRPIIKEAMKKVTSESGLTLVEIIPGLCPGGCYKVKFQVGDEFNTVEVTMPEGEQEDSEKLKEGWNRYTDDENKFSVAYPESYKVTEDRYGWPDAVLILYNGGQSYDMVVEKWDTAAEYQERYKNTKNLSVFKTTDGYLTVLNMNFDSEVDEITATFKVLE